MSKLLRGRNRAKIGSVDDFENQEDWLNNGEWVKPDEWLDISNVANNEIHMLATDGYVGFSCTLSSSGTYSIDWGDGTVETLRASATVYHHQYNAANGGYMPNLDMWQYKIRIYSISTTITRFQVNTSTSPYNGAAAQNCSILWFYTKINTFTSCDNMFARSRLLEAVSIPHCSSCTTTSGMFSTCHSLVSYKSPILWSNSITNVGNMFEYCNSIHTINFPITWGTSLTANTSNIFTSCNSLKRLINFIFPSSTNLAGIFNSCLSLSKTFTVNTPNATQSGFLFAGTSIKKAIITNWGTNNTSKTYMFNSCFMLKEVILPVNKSTGATNSVQNIFYSCVNLTTITNISSLGHDTIDTNADQAFTQAYALTGILTIDFRLSKFGCDGANATYKMKITGLRLTHPSSGFGGTSPQINCSYCDFSASALNTLFGDLPTLTGKTINITGCTGAATCDRTIATAKGWTVTG